jgi:outer membrane immunogenic protein
MMFRTLAALALTAAAVPALAADLPTRKSAPVMAVVSPLYNWTGFYAGVQGGWVGGGRDRVGFYPSTQRMPSYNNLGNLAPQGGFIGARLGYDWQAVGSPFVVGAVADFNGDWGKRSISGLTLAGLAYTGRAKMDWDGSLRLRAGYAFNRFLVYATGGLAVAHEKYRLDGAFGPFTSSMSSGKTLVGGTIGAGLAYAVTNNMTVGLEYRYSAFGSKSVTAPIYLGGASVGTVHTKQSPNFHRVAATLDWKF